MCIRDRPDGQEKGKLFYQLYTISGLDTEKHGSTTKTFSEDKDTTEAVQNLLHTTSKIFFIEGIQKLVKKWTK